MSFINDSRIKDIYLPFKSYQFVTFFYTDTRVPRTAKSLFYLGSSSFWSSPVYSPFPRVRCGRRRVSFRDVGLNPEKGFTINHVGLTLVYPPKCPDRRRTLLEGQQTWSRVGVLCQDLPRLRFLPRFPGTFTFGISDLTPERDSRGGRRLTTPSGPE